MTLSSPLSILEMAYSCPDFMLAGRKIFKPLEDGWFFHEIVTLEQHTQLNTGLNILNVLQHTLLNFSVWCNAFPASHSCQLMLSYLEFTWRFKTIFPIESLPQPLSPGNNIRMLIVANQSERVCRSIQTEFVDFLKV